MARTRAATAREAAGRVSPATAKRKSTGGRVTKKKKTPVAKHTHSTREKPSSPPIAAVPAVPPSIDLFPLAPPLAATAPPLTPANGAAPDFFVVAAAGAAVFDLTVYRGEGMCLLAMDWKQGTPPDNFVGFAIEYQEPGGGQFYALPNRIAFAGPGDDTAESNTKSLSSRLSPFQKFRWIHFPLNAGTPGIFTYRVTPVFMDPNDSLTYGDFQEAGTELEAETYPGELNICFTRGFISSQAFVQHFGTNGGVGTILPTTANASLDFVPTDPKAEAALAWMGFEARTAILGALDSAIADPTAQVRVAAYDFNDPQIVTRLQQLGDRLKIIIDDSGSHRAASSAESRAAAMLVQSAGAENVQRQHMGGLQHNKTVVVDGDQVKMAIGGSTNFSWSGLYVQNNNAVVLHGPNAVQIFTSAFDALWKAPNKPADFRDTAFAGWNDLGLPSVQASVTFSPHDTENTVLQGLADDIAGTESSLLYSLAFLYETKGAVRDAIETVTARDGVFVYGLSDKTVGGLDLQRPNGNPPVAFPGDLLRKVPPPFDQEATGGSGTRLHHEFVVIDFNKPTARVYTGSYNFSVAADSKNGENLFLIRDRRVATSYMIQAVAMYDHYEFRDTEAKAGASDKALQLQKPPRDQSQDKPWWDKYWTDPQLIHDRTLFGNQTADG